MGDPAEFAHENMSGNVGLFKCPSCGALVRGDLSLPEGLVCGECQYQFEKPAPKDSSAVLAGVASSKPSSSNVIRNVTGQKSSLPEAPAPEFATKRLPAKSLEEVPAQSPSGSENSRDEETIMPDGSRRVRRRKKRPAKEKHKGLILFLFGWAVMIAIVFLLFKVGEKKKPDEGPGPGAGGGDGISPFDRTVLTRSIPIIQRDFQSFMAFPTIEGRDQFIDRPSDLVYQFGRFYQENTFPSMRGDSQLVRLKANVLNFSNETVAVETVWSDGGDGRWGALHVFDPNQGWKLDWEHFAPYSSVAWNRFSSRLGTNEGTFRVLARKRFTSDQSETFSVSFYRPPRVYEQSNGFLSSESSEVVIETDSELGRRFRQLWQSQVVDGTSPYGSILADEIGPPSNQFLRVIVKLAWEENEPAQEGQELKEDEKYKLVLKDIIGIGWFGSRIQELHQKALDAAAGETEEQVLESGSN